MIGFTPEQVDRMSLWEFTACVEGYRAAHAPSDELPPPPTKEQFEAMKEARARWMH